MGSGISIETDVDLAYDFIATVDATSRGGEKGMEILKTHLQTNPRRLLRVRLSRSAMMHLRRKEIVEMSDVIDTNIRERSMGHIHRRGIEFERAVEQGILELGDTLLHIAARRGDMNMCLYLIEQGGDRGILDANSRGYIPAEVTSNKDIERDLNDLALVFEVCGARFELQDLAWGLLKDVRRVWSCWMINSFHEAGCIVRALTQLKRSDSTFFTTLSNLLVRESQKIGRKVHKRGLEIAQTILYNTRYNDELLSTSRKLKETGRSSMSGSKQNTHRSSNSNNKSYKEDDSDADNDDDQSKESSIIVVDRIIDPSTIDLTKPFNVDKIFEAFTDKTSNDELWDICKEIFKYVCYKDPYWEKPES